MINILPPQVKSDRRYGRLNRFAIRQLIYVLIIAVAAVGFMLSGLEFVRSDEDEIVEQIAAKESEYEPLKVYETQAKEFNEQIKRIDTVFNNEVKFSELIVDIASALPIGSRVSSLSLAGDSQDPLQLQFELSEQVLAGVVRKSLVDSGVFISADVLSVSASSGTQLDAEGNTIVLEFPFTASIQATLNPDRIQESPQTDEVTNDTETQTEEQPTTEEQTNEDEEAG